MSTRGQGSENSGMARQIRPVALSVLIGAVSCSLLLLLFSLVLSARDVPQAAMDPMASAALVVGGFAGGFCCARMKRENGLAYGALCGAILTALLLIAGLAIGDGGFGVPALLKAALLMLSAMLGGVLGVNTKRRRRK